MSKPLTKDAPTSIGSAQMRNKSQQKEWIAMKIVMVCLLGWVLSVGVGAESVIEGQVRLASGEAAVGGTGAGG